MEEPDQEFTREILRKVRQIEISSNRLVSEALAGSYHSAFKGQGIDFEEVREYQPGEKLGPLIGMLPRRWDFHSSNNTEKREN